jgi:hypothetical protein
MPSSSRFLPFCLATILFSAAGLFAQTSPSAPNSDPTYQQLRNIGLGSEAVSVKDFTLKRDAATFHLTSGNVCFVSAIEGKVTGAVFVGEGNMVLDPPLAIERGTLKLLTKENEFSEKFTQLVMRFTDKTYEEIKKVGGAATASCDADLLHNSQNALRHNLALRFNLDARILQDVSGTAPGGLFVAFIHGQRYSDKEVYAIDPHGAPPLLFPVAPEEVELLTYDDKKMGVWAAFHLSNEYKQDTASGSQNNGLIRIEHQQLDTTLEKNANLVGKATTAFVSQVNGLKVVPFELYPTLRVQSVTTENGQPLSFIQQGKDEDAKFFSVILPSPLATGEKLTIVTSYGGKDAVWNEGNGNYFPAPGARDSWYPNNPSQAFGGFTNYDLTFHIPKGMKITATGSLVRESSEGDHTTSVWKSEVPQTVAGFNFGNFNVQEAKITKPDYVVQSYANKEPPLWVKNLQHEANGEDNLEVTHDYIGGRAEVALGNMNTTPMQKKALADGEISMELYTDYFGPIPFKRLAMTQQTACGVGQSWPTLVWLPICSFYDNTVRHQLGLDRGDRGYWKTVAPHEVAHQWWGNVVGFNSYRDQWMSEGFADMSASLFLQVVEKNPKKFIDFWNDERELLTMKDPQGYRAIDAGPVTLGYRLDNSRTGMNLTRDLIYPKGAYILHMVRMMMWDKQTGDQNFKATMQDFVKTYAGRAATTEDFKAMVEKHMTPEMAGFGGGKMDWFFDESVYGTQLPSYNMQSSIDNNAAGDMEFAFKLTQSNVDANFRMLVPLYIELADGSVRFLGRARLTGNTSIEQKIPLKGLKDKPHRLFVNYYDDVLASAN